MTGFLRRLGAWSVQMLVCLDQLLGTWLRGWWYVWLGGELPRADEPISSWVGRRSAEGHGWARAAERALDLLFFWQPDHCRIAARNAEEDLDD